jgi:hypothetical protein
MTTHDSHDVAAKELRRWMAWLGLPTLAAAAFLGASLAGFGAWFLAPAIVVGPGFGAVALVWLALTSDTNAGGAQHAHAEGKLAPQLAVAVAEPE